MKGFRKKPAERPIRQEVDNNISSEHAERELTGLKKYLSRKWLLTAAGACLITGSLLLAGSQYVDANTITYVRVFVDGKDVGAVHDEEQLQKLYDEKLKELQDKYPDVKMEIDTTGITTTPEKSFKPEIHSEETLHQVSESIDSYAKGVELVVDGKVIGIVKDQKTADQVLEQVKKKYAPEYTASSKSAKLVKVSSTSKKKASAGGSVTSVEIQEDVDTKNVTAEPTKILSMDQAVQVLTTGTETPLMYTVQEGDTISSIAKRYEIKQADIFNNNPGVSEKYLQIGDELQLTVPKLPITVTTVEEVSEEIITEPQVEIRKSSQLAAGESKVVRQGREGLKIMNYRVTKENGHVVREEWLGQEVVTPSLTEVVLQGTKIAGKGSGQFSWPVKGASISSSYGSRWGRTHKGIDIVSGNRSILASDEGVVTFAGVKSGYGNTIIIDHKNGYKTLYGHLSSISVKNGQTVEKGTKIGVMGNTGRSTGTHLHFEILVNNAAKNPMKYLP